ncbi:LysR family transcriptional regulator [Comamonas sp. Z1]|uniref:winged helix-turn-helix domain-containing protein n=1 Tax=Comamonas sp. Z1 TaxID=2601246 RepID=UPI0011E88365|nr:LysR family transcriptional regulator [Comamonas sp. Z1]TYK76454.1 LysR family transcriptional regulator [Comamonas sp. Z1]
MKTTVETDLHTQATKFRVAIKHGIAIGPGKADLLQAVEVTGSIAEASRQLGMSYQRAWMLVKAMNEDFVAPLVSKQRGGSKQGGAQLTDTGKRVLAIYRAAESDALQAIGQHLPSLQALLANPSDQ